MSSLPFPRLAQSRSGRDERGAVAVLAAAGLVVALISASFAVDLGSMVEEARRNQKVADLAALDAARVFPTGHVAEASVSALRNKFPTSAGYSITTVEGVKVGDKCQASVGAGTVCVTATSPHSNFFPFVPGGQTISRSAVAGMEDKAQFSIGSNLATLNPTDDAALDRMMTALLGTDSTVDLSVVSYKGIAAGSVSLADLIAADPSLGTPDQLLTTPITVRRLAEVTVLALNNKGDLASTTAATALASFASDINSSLTMELGEILAVEQPADPGSVSAQTQFNVFDLITGAGQAGVSNGAGFFDVPDLTVSVPGLGTTTLKVTVIEPPRISAFGPARYDTSTMTWATTAQTAQVKVELNTRISVGNCGGLLPTCVDWQLPLKVSAAKATGSLTDVRCPSDSTTKEADILVQTEGANATSDNRLTVKLLGLNLLPPLSLVSTNVALAGSTPPHETLPFSGPPFPTAIQSASAHGAGLTTATQSKLTLLGILPVGSLLDLVSPVTDAVDNEILEPVFNALGLSVAGADVRVLRVECGVPGLVG